MHEVRRLSSHMIIHLRLFTYFLVSQEGLLTSYNSFTCWSKYKHRLRKINANYFLKAGYCFARKLGKRQWQILACSNYQRECCLIGHFHVLGSSFHCTSGIRVFFNRKKVSAKKAFLYDAISRYNTSSRGAHELLFWDHSFWVFLG